MRYKIIFRKFVLPNQVKPFATWVAKLDRSFRLENASLSFSAQNINIELLKKCFPEVIEAIEEPKVDKCLWDLD